MPYIGTTAQPAINTPTNATTYTVTGLTNGTAYTFTVAATNSVGTGAPSAASAALTPGAGYSNVIFADGFESGDLTNWNGIAGQRDLDGDRCRRACRHLRPADDEHRRAVLVHPRSSLASSFADSSVSFWVRLNSGSGLQTLAEARDGSSSAHMWDLYYNWNTQSLILEAYRATGADEVTTGPGSVLPGGWVKLSVQYTATSTGGARLYVNDVTQPAWMTAGNYTRAANLQILQLWNDAVGSTDFDDVRIATPPPPGATLPSAPTGVSGLARDHAVALTWTRRRRTAAARSAATESRPGLRTATLDPVYTPYANTSYTVTGLTNGTAYTFAVAADQRRGHRPGLEPLGRSHAHAGYRAGHPLGGHGHGPGRLRQPRWTAPSDGGASITGYWVTPYVGGSARAFDPDRVDGDELPRHGAHQRRDLHVLGRRTKLGWTRCGFGADAAGHSARSSVAVHGHDLLRRLRVRDPERLEQPAGHRRSSVISGAAHTGGFGLRVRDAGDAVRLRREGAQRVNRGQPHELLGPPRLGLARRHGRSNAGQLVQHGNVDADVRRHATRVPLLPVQQRRHEHRDLHGRQQCPRRRLVTGSGAVHRPRHGYRASLRQRRDTTRLGSQRELQPHEQPADDPALERRAHEQRLRRLSRSRR